MEKRYYDRSCFERIQPQGGAYEIKLTTKQTEVKKITFVFNGDILGLVARTEQLEHVKRRNAYQLTYLDDEVIIDINPLYITDKVTYSGFTSAHIAYLFIKDFFEFTSARIPTKNNTSTNEPSIIKTPDEVTSKLSTEQKDSVNGLVDTKPKEIRGVSDKPSYIARFIFTTDISYLFECALKVNASFDDIEKFLTINSNFQRIGVINFKHTFPHENVTINLLDPDMDDYKDIDLKEFDFDKFKGLIHYFMASYKDMNSVFKNLKSLLGENSVVRPVFKKEQPDDNSANHNLKASEIPIPDKVTDEKPDKESYIIKILFTTPADLSFRFACACKVNVNFDDIVKSLSRYTGFHRIGNNFSCSLPKFTLTMGILNPEHTKYKDTQFYELERNGLIEVIEYCVKGDIYRLRSLAENKVTIIE